MRVDLPSGHFAELRDDFLHGDVRFAKKAAKFRSHRQDDGGTFSDVDLSFEDEVTGAILYRMIITWDVGQSVPRQAQNLDLALGILDMLPEDDFDALRKAVRPWYLKVMGRPAEDEESPKAGSAPTVTSSSGVPALDGPATPSTTDTST